MKHLDVHIMGILGNQGIPLLPGLLVMAVVRLLGVGWIQTEKPKHDRNG